MMNVKLILLLIATPWHATAFVAPTSSLHQHATIPLSADTLEAPPSAESGQSASARASAATTSSLDEMNTNFENPFELLSSLASKCLFDSDMFRDAYGQPGGAQGSSATNWINDASAFALRSYLNRLELQLPEQRKGVDRDEAGTWIRWMKSAPTPLIIDLSNELRVVANQTINGQNLEYIDMTRERFLQRLGCRLILLPSGAALQQPLVEPPGSLLFGKLLYGGVTRYRLLQSSNSNRPPRRAGERTETRSSVKENIPAWIQYGGPERIYEAVDMGAAAVLEVMLMPRGKEMSEHFQETFGDMSLSRIVWEPQNMFCFESADKAGEGDEIDFVTGSLPSTLSGKERNEAFKNDFQTSVGGLQDQIESIVRRVLDGRVIRPAEVADDENAEGQDETTVQLAAAAMEAEELAVLGLTPVKGLLLYGPPGCGKTALAREISRALKAREPKIVSAPELLDRWVGGSERLVRSLFADAEAELAACNGDATKSALHVVVVDEIDAVFRKRSSGEESGEVTRASAVNQILAKLDGVNSIPNVLMIGMTNRRELIDEALLRPGRLEVQIEIPLPNKEGRREILQIHFGTLREKGRLSRPLCCSIDGVAGYGDDTVVVSAQQDVAKPKGKFRGMKEALGRFIPDAVKPTYDLAADYATGGFSGADLAGLVRCAGSLALSRARKDGNGVEGLLITLDDVKQALKEVKR